MDENMYRLHYDFSSTMRNIVLKWLAGLRFRQCMKPWTCRDFPTTCGDSEIRRQENIFLCIPKKSNGSVCQRLKSTSPSGSNPCILIFS